MPDWRHLEAARSYAERGWAVLPLHSIENGRCTCGRDDCPSPGKHPLTPHGVKDATTDLDQVQAWWLEWPWANIGIATGSQSGIAVIDVDERAGGFLSLSQIAPMLPETLTVQTGGGLHWYLAVQEPIHTRQIAPGIELRGDGSYVVAPPSRHANGRDYQWIRNAPIAPMPPALAAAKDSAKATRNGRITVEPMGHWVADLLRSDITEGQRNTTLTRLAGYLRNTLPYVVTLQILREWNAAHCFPPLPEREVVQVVEGIYRRYGPTLPVTIESWTAQSLLAERFPPPRQIVAGILPEGLALLGGRPKRGKSWLALQLAVDVITGRSSMGRVDSGRVIVLALEDSPRRLQQRLIALDCPPTSNLHLVTNFPPLHAGGISDLCDLIERFDPVLVVIDTLSRAFVGLQEQDRSDQMTRALAPLQKLALERRIAILVIDHHRKPGPDVVDMIDDIIGSTAKVGVADTILGLYRKTGEDAALLKITGRDIEERELALRWDSIRFRWRCEGDAAEMTYLSHRKAVLDLLSATGEADIDTISQHLSLTERATRDVLQRMRQENAIAVRYETGRRGRPRALYTLHLEEGR